jgi:hypothetical protein
VREMKTISRKNGKECDISDVARCSAELKNKIKCKFFE